jgi:predicted naringenin-chalcone synthase
MIEDLIILTDDDFEPDDGSKGGWNEPIQRVTGKLREVKLDPAQVEAKMSAFVHMVGRIFRQSNAEILPNSGLQLEEVELVVKISAKGQVQLIAGSEVGGEGGITLKFKRLDSKDNGK